MWSIRVLSGQQTGQIFDLKLGKNLLGRGPSCDFKVLSVGISKEHCEIHVYKDKMMIVDLKSSNGTFVNGVKIQNSIVNLGDKVSLFDVIMDIIPTPDIRPKPIKPLVVTGPQAGPINPPLTPQMHMPSNLPPQAMAGQMPVFPQQQMGMYNGNMAYQINPQMSAEVQYGLIQNQMAQPSQSTVQPAAPQKSLKEKIEFYFDNTVMPAIYKLAIVMPFKHVLLGFVMLFIVGVTLLSLLPMTSVIKESNYTEAAKRAKSVARALARVNETALLAGQFSNLTVSDALKEDGIREAIIIQQSDGSIIAPSEKAGRQINKPFIAQARKESRSAQGMVDSNTIGATHPIGVYDANTGESQIKYHAIIYYDVSSLGVDTEKIISLFMQTLIVASILGFMLYVLFSRLIQYPLTALNLQIDQALRDKSDRTEVLFDYPEFQKVVANVNLLLNRMWNGLGDQEQNKPQQNRDLEFIQMLEMISQPALVINSQNTVIAVNSQFEQLSQMSRENLMQQNFTTITDSALVQNIESLVARATASPYEKHTDRIPFAQFECHISIQASLGSNGEPEYFFLTLTRIEEAQ